LTGFDGGSLKNKVNISLHVQTEMGAYGIVEDTHMVVGHIITELLKVQSAKENING
jgi:D-sedoheptulose 7-phosphate isomerase